MKTLLLLISLTIATNGFCQIEIKTPEKENIISTVKMGNYLHSQLSYKLDGKDTMYYLLYRNSKYSTLTDFQTIAFSSYGNTLSTLYEILKSFFADEHKKDKDYKKSFRLGDQDVDAYNYRSLGITAVTIITTKGYFYLTEKQLDRLFGKN